MSRVSTYLNFPRNTEDAFNFYKSVFGGEFSGGITRLGETFGSPDAPESMGFNINFGNNVHIMLEPDSRSETKKLFEALSKKGKVTMDLQDMFWGAYYGSCTDKYGVQWMFNCNEK
jgi:PhnB protein